MSTDDFYGCYFPDHSKAYNQTKCNASASNSWCCNKNDICLDNGYCMQTSDPYSNRLGRGSCSDSTWSSPACPQRCADVRPTNQIGLYLAYDKPSGAFCCGTNFNSTTRACGTATGGSTDPFDLTAGNVIYNRTSGAAIKSGTLTWDDLGVSTNSTSASAVSATSSSSSSSSANAVTAAPAPNSNILSIALGIAVPLGVLLIAALIACGILFVQNRRLRKEAREARETREGPAAPPKDNVYRQSSIHSPAPMYEHGQTNWAPFHPQQHQQAANAGSHASQAPQYYAKVAEHDVVAQEVPADYPIGELPANTPSTQQWKGAIDQR